MHSGTFILLAHEKGSELPAVDRATNPQVLDDSFFFEEAEERAIFHPFKLISSRKFGITIHEWAVSIANAARTLLYPFSD